MTDDEWHARDRAAWGEERAALSALLRVRAMTSEEVRVWLEQQQQQRAEGTERGGPPWDPVAVGLGGAMVGVMGYAVLVYIGLAPGI